jgi:DNA-binding protein HU-beta
MAEKATVNKQELVQRLSDRLQQDPQTVEKFLDATIEEITDSLKQQRSVSLRNFGTFYIRGDRDSSVFKFNPSQRLRKLFGWASTYKGDP